MKDHKVEVGVILSPPDKPYEWKIKMTPYCKVCMERVVKKRDYGYRHFDSRYDLN